MAIKVTDTYTLVVMQPGTLCNLNCSYCYLPLRQTKTLMSADVAAAVAQDIAQQDNPKRVSVLWHGGEPTAVPIDTFEELLEPFEKLRADGRIRHGIQTNATLINDTWCELFTRYGFRVGVSIDGPEQASAQRTDWAGRPSFDRIMRGIRHLQHTGLDPHVICVVTPESIHHGDGIMRFLDHAGFTQIGFNIEEREGVNTSRPLVDPEAARAFWRQIINYCRSSPRTFYIREFGNLSRHLQGKPVPNRDVLPTVAVNGDITLLSPELAGMQSTEYGDFIVGNVLTASIQSVLTRHHDIPYVAEFEQSVNACRSSCSFWNVCYGGYASNKWAETGDFRTTETSHCRNGAQAVVRATADLVDPNTDQGLIETLERLTLKGAAHA
jgi:uncharacterized protein